MFRSLLILILSTASVFAGNAGSAILALQTVAGQSYAANANIVELQGKRADPMPSEWLILLADSSARGGVREVSVANGAITAERTPLRGFQDVSGMPALRPSEVSVDNTSLFESVHRQAEDAHLAFHWLDYSLKTDAAIGQPVWTVRLFDEMGTAVGTMTVDAKGGAIVQSLQMPDGLPLKTTGRKNGWPHWKNRRLHAIHCPQGR
jgi:hypothetical protein